MRIVVASLHPRPFSGQIHSLRALAQTLATTGNHVWLRSAALPGGPSRLPSLVRYAVSALGLLRTLVRAADDADVVHLCLPTPGFTLVADWLATHTRTPLVVGYEAPLISGNLVGSVVREVWRELGFYAPRLLINNRLVAKAAQYRAGAYVVSSRYQQAQLQQLGVKARIAVIPNVVELPDGGDDEWEAIDHPALARRRIGLPERVPLVGYIGHFHPVKGVETLVRAFAQLRAHAPEARLVLAWSGLGDRGAIASLLDQLGCSDRTIWLGRTSLPDLLRALDVLALPYRHPIGQNAFPNVLLEAHGLGVPLVSTRIPVVAEACQAPETALLVSPDEPGDLATAVGSLLDDVALREAMVRQQRLRFAERFAPVALARRYLGLYRSVQTALEQARTAPARAVEAVRL